MIVRSRAPVDCGCGPSGAPLERGALIVLLPTDGHRRLGAGCLSAWRRTRGRASSPWRSDVCIAQHSEHAMILQEGGRPNIENMFRAAEYLAEYEGAEPKTGLGPAGLAWACANPGLGIERLPPICSVHYVNERGWEVPGAHLGDPVKAKPSRWLDWNGQREASR